MPVSKHSTTTDYRVPAYEVLDALGIGHGPHDDVDVSIGGEDEGGNAEIIISVTEYSSPE